MNFIANRDNKCVHIGIRCHQIVFCIIMVSCYPCFGGRARVVTDSIGTHGTVAAQKPTGSVPEVPYWAVQYTSGGTTKTKYFATTAWTYSVNLNSGKNILTDSDAFDNANAFESTIGDIWNLGDCSEPAVGTDWRRNYNGVFSAYVLNATFNNNNPWMFAIMHCENKNESIWRSGCEGVRCDYESTIIDEPVGGWTWPDDYSGGTTCSSGTYTDCSLNYLGLIGMTCCPIPTYDGKYLQTNDRGPILWPSSGYVDANGTKLTDGLRHPTAIIDNNMIYCFFKDCAYSESKGIKVARCPASLYGFENYWETWYIDPCNGETWVDSLPDGFDKDYMEDFYDVPGGGSSSIVDFDSTNNSFRFSAAKVAGTAWYLGMEYHYHVGGTSEIGLRVSRDLIHWSYLTTIPNTNGYFYPIFANTTCTNNMLINRDNFYILASVNNGASVKYIPMDISIAYDVPADYTSDNKTDMTVYRPSTNWWYTYGAAAAQVGTYDDDIPLTGDVDGDHKADRMVFKPTNCSWYVKYSGGAADANLGCWGASYDIPLLGDVDGDGFDDRVIFRPTNARWYGNDGASFGTEYEFGQPGDIPFLADRDGDSKADRCVWRPSDGTWHFKFASGLPVESTSAYGSNGDVPLLADYDNDGKVERAYFRPSTGTWYVTDGGSWACEDDPNAQWGQNGDIPLIGDWDGDGLTDRGTYRPGTGYWYTNCSTGPSPGNVAVGCSRDVPLGCTLYGQQGLFYQQPASQTKTAGQSVTFYAKAFGRSLSYQWKKNGNTIAGATSDSYTIASVGESDEGNYSCTITIPLTCPAGSYTKISLSASLTVN